MAKNPTRNAPRAEPNHSPVSIPAGSYDFNALQSGLDKAVDTYDNRDAEVAKALDSARAEGSTTSFGNPASLPDHTFVEVPTALDGDGNPVSSQTIQVYDPKKEDQHVAALQPVAPSASDVGIGDDGKPTDLEKARIAAVKAGGEDNVDTAPDPADAPATGETTNAG